MKTIVASLIITLAAYAQACCADNAMFRSQVTLSNYSESTVQPTWLFGTKGQLQFMGFTQISQTLTQGKRQPETEKHLGFGLHQQHSPFMYTQILMSEKNGGQPAIKLGVDF